jgi:hypothetical protein
MLRGFAWLSAGVLIGFMLGGVAPSLELVRVRKDLVLAEREREQVSGGFRSVVPGLDQALQVGRQPMAASSARPTDKNSKAVSQPAAARGLASAGGPAPSRAKHRGDPLEQFNGLEAAQQIRAAQSRAALIEQAGLDPEQLARFDAALVNMNGKLANHSEQLMEMYLSKQRPSPQQMLSVGHQVSGVMLEAQKVLDEMLGPTQPGDLEDSPQQIWNYIDLSVFRPSVEQALRRESVD